MAEHSETYKRIMAKRRKQQIIKRRIISGVACGAVLTGIMVYGISLEPKGSESAEVSQAGYTDYYPEFTADEWEQIQQEKAAYEEAERAEAEALQKSIEEYTKRSQAQAEADFLEARKNLESYSFIEKTDSSLIKSRDWDAEDGYLLAKIAMAEAESEDTEGKALVILTVLNRVWSPQFPGTIREVIFEENQFTPIKNGRWDRVEPDEDCYKALSMVEQGWDESKGALYFELTTNETTWHNTNLKKLFTHGATTFYTEKEDSQ